MAMSATAPVAQSNIKWHEATFQVKGNSVLVQYLSDRELSNGQIADLVARGQDYGRVWINGRAQGSAAGIERAAEMIRGAGEPTETGVVRRATQAEIERFTGSRIVEAAESAASHVAGRVVGAVENVVEAFGLSGVRPVRTEAGTQRAGIVTGGRQRPGQVVAETAMGETGSPVSAAEEVQLPEQPAGPAAETARPAERRGQASYTTIPYSTMRGAEGVAYQFEVVYDSSRPGVGIPPVDKYGLTEVSFFDSPGNRAGVVRYRYRREGGEWGAWHAPGRNGQEFHRDYMRLTRTPLRYEVRDAEGVVARFNIYLDPDAAQDFYGTRGDAETRRRITDGLASAEDPLEFLRNLQKNGLIAGFSTQSEREGEVIWVKGNINNFLAALERTYGKDATRLGFTLA